MAGSHKQLHWFIIPFSSDAQYYQCVLFLWYKTSYHDMKKFLYRDMLPTYLISNSIPVRGEIKGFDRSLN